MRRFIGPLAIVITIIAVGYGLYYVTKPDPNDPRSKLATCLTAKGVTMYGAYWCPHCNAQKQFFGRGVAFNDTTTTGIHYIECGVPGNTQARSQACQDAGISSYPTWEFPDKSRVTGEQPLKDLATKAGCSVDGL